MRAPVYQPENRRPISGLFRRSADGTVRWCVRHAVHPDTISYSSIAVSFLAAVCYWRAGRLGWLLIVAPLLCEVRLWFNMLDGMVAIAAGVASPRGEILNDFPDRISDVLIFTGVAHSGLAHPLSGYWAAIFALLTAYVGTLGQAAGARREFGGIMSKPWRMILLHVGAWLTLASMLLGGGHVRPPGLTLLDWTCLLIVAGCVQTIAVRLRSTFRLLGLRAARGDEN